MSCRGMRPLLYCHSAVAPYSRNFRGKCTIYLACVFSMIYWTVHYYYAKPTFSLVVRARHLLQSSVVVKGSGVTLGMMGLEVELSLNIIECPIVCFVGAFLADYLLQGSQLS